MPCAIRPWSSLPQDVIEASKFLRSKKKKGLDSDMEHTTIQILANEEKTFGKRRCALGFKPALIARGRGFPALPSGVSFPAHCHWPQRQLLETWSLGQILCAI